MASVITIAFEGWKAQEAASGKPVLLNEFVFANVPNLDPNKPIDRNEKLPPANQIVHRQAVNKAGLASENAVAYSVTLGADVGDFDFNWIGLLNKESNTVAMITHAPSQKKLKTQNGQQGNVLIRSFLLEFQGAAEETQIKTSAETWQIDFTARLTGIDEMQRLINVDSYGAAAFFDDGFEVTRSAEQFTVKKGLGYVGGLRGKLEQNQILNGLRNTKVYADFSYQGNIVSQWRTVIKITAAATLTNYVDAAGFTHQVFAVASIDASGNVKDLRPKGALSNQSLAEFEKKFNSGLDKKQDKGDYALRGESYTKTETNIKFQPIGNYQPSGDYATNTALNNGLALKFDKTGGTATGAIMAANEIGAKTDGAHISLITSDKVRGAHIASRKDGETNYLRHNLPARSGTFMQLGDCGFGGDAGYETLNEQQTVDKFKSGISQIWRGNTQDTTYSFKFGTNFLAYSSDTFFNLAVGTYGANLGSVRITAGVSTQDKSTYKVIDLYSSLNVSPDRNGNLKLMGSSDELSDYPVGSPIPWTQETPPAGYLICWGQSFNKATYPLLAKAYPSGTLPDLRAEFIRGLDINKNVDNGRVVLSAQASAYERHSHARNGDGLEEWMNSGIDGNLIGEYYNGSGGRSYIRKYSNTGTSGSNETRPRNIAFLYIVRAA
ncbi:phage tail protein [Shewanella sp.]|uniref:phage tail-collar fiber domain-containing protein n=1 Tax=Shewanella sp. TaxID=50422 RepID=UPI001B3FB742|nr:phage tail protein [Shewanella sp.]MBP6518676.1 phage tail protein [Shewanella sp.]